MKTIRILPALLLIALSTSCVPLASFYQLWDEEHARELPGLEGLWTESDGGTMTFAKGKDRAYQVTFAAEKEMSRYEVHVVQLDNRYFMDFYPDEESLDKRLAGEAYNSLIPAHFFCRFTLAGDMLQLQVLDDEKTESRIGTNNPAAPLLKRGSQLMLTADTKTLQKLIATLADDPEVWGTLSAFSRKKH